MISSNLSNRLIFVFSLLGLFVASFLFYEYNIDGTIICPTGRGCDLVRASPYSSFLGISMPILGIIFYLTMAMLSVVHFRKLQLLVAVSGVVFGMYLTFLEAFVIRAFCFWCILSFIISLAILISVLLGRRNYDKRN